LGQKTLLWCWPRFNKLIREGRNIISFCIGQPDFATPQHIQDAGIAAIQQGKHGYTPSAGIPNSRQAAADYFSRTRGIQVDADDVVVGAGAKPFIGYTIQSVTDHGAGTR
jgi:aspartate/methionine/tyrosine aminotransferase